MTTDKMTTSGPDWKESIARCLQSGIYKSYTAGLYTDVEIQVHSQLHCSFYMFVDFLTMSKGYILLD